MFDFSDPEFAARFRDTIRQIVSDEVDKLRPRTRYGTVQAIDLANRKCLVILNGDVDSVPVSFGTLAPASVGQIVRVGGVAGDKYIEDVMGVSMGNWRTFESSLNSNWGLGTGGSLLVKYCIVGRHCTVSWEVRFGSTPVAGDVDSLLEIKMPFNPEPGRKTIGVGTGTTLFDRVNFVSEISDGYLRLYNEATPDGVKAGDPLAILEYTVFSGTHTYEVGAFDLYLYTLWNVPFPGD